MGSRSGGGGRGNMGLNAFNNDLTQKQWDYRRKLIQQKGMTIAQADAAVRLFPLEINNGYPLPERLQVK